MRGKGRGRLRNVLNVFRSLKFIFKEVWVLF